MTPVLKFLPRSYGVFSQGRPGQGPLYGSVSDREPPGSVTDHYSNTGPSLEVVPDLWV